MRQLFKMMVIGLFAATPVFSGGWEANRLDTSMMYNEGDTLKLAPPLQP